MHSERPSPPSPDEWRLWDVDVTGELYAGKQSRVFDALLCGERSAIKLTESRLTDIAALTSRMEVVEALGAAHPNVVPPTRIDGALVQPIGEWLMTATKFVTGEQLDESAASDAERLGSALAGLHRAMRQIQGFDIPTMAPLDFVTSDRNRAGWQLLHGDFSTQNVIASPDLIRIFDFDDCGYGPIEYDLANSLYMVLFDSEIAKRPERYEIFRPAFLSGYADRSNHRVADAAIDEMIAIRIDALGRWLDDLTIAPIGIRTSSPEWIETLASFVRLHSSVNDR